MPYVQLRDVRLGMDRKRSSRVVSEAGSAWTIRNAHLSRGGDVEKKRKFVRQNGSFPASTKGLYAINEALFTNGHDLSDESNVPAGVTHLHTPHPTDASVQIDNVLQGEGFDGTLYTIVQFNDGNIFHYYGEDRVADWDSLSDNIGSNESIAASLTSLIDNSSAVNATSTRNVINITSQTAGTPFTIAQSTTDNGVDNTQAMTINTLQSNVTGVEGELATAQITINGGTSVNPNNTVESITIDGVNVMDGFVNWSVSNSNTASDVADMVNNSETTPNYTASASGPVITISAAPDTGDTPNMFVVDVVTGGDVTETHNDTMIGGVTAVTAVSQVETVTIEGAFEREDIFTITINGSENYTISSGSSGMGTSLLTFRQKLYSTASSSLYFSSLNNAADWTTGLDFGFINMASQTAGQERLTALQEYQGLMVIFSENNVRVWNISEDSDANAFIETLQNTGTIAPRSVIPYGNNDVFYLDTSGIRSIRARDSSNAAYVSDVGTDIDTHVREYLDTLTEQDAAKAIGVVEPIDGRFWLAIKNRIYVFSHFPSGQISAWSYYDTDFDIQDIAKVDKRIFVRGTENGVDYLYLYGGENGVTYGDKGEDIVSIELPFFSAQDPATEKVLQGFDIVGINNWKVEVLPDPNNLDVKVNHGVSTDTTYGDERFGATGVTPLFAVNLTCDEAGLATLSALAMHYESTDDGG